MLFRLTNTAYRLFCRVAFRRDLFAVSPSGETCLSLQATLLTNSDPNAGQVINAKIYRTLGGRRDTELPVSSHEVGDATFSFTSCDHLTVQYRFAQSVAVKPFQNLMGQLNLVRTGACR